MIASSSASASLTSSTTTGTSWMPARWAARQRRSPAMISKLPEAPGAGRTAIGWMMPRSLMEAASSSSSRAANCRRGLRGLGCRNSIATRRWPRERSGLLLVSAPMSPIRDARPRPSRERAGSSAIVGSPEKSFTPAPRQIFVASLLVTMLVVGSARGMSHQFALALDNLGGEPEVGFAAHAFEIIDQHRLP